MERMLINATQPEELRVAIADGQKLLDLDLEVPSQEQKKANIYKGKITRIEPSLEACFVDYGAERHGFLPLKEISRENFKPEALQTDERVDIKDALESGQEIIIQVEKEERGNKGAALTTFVSLAGRYLVLMPNNPRAGGVSRQVTGEDRKQVKEAIATLEMPEGMGLIVRTAGVGREAEELKWDLDYLLQLWKAIGEAAKTRKAPFLIYQESNLIIRALRDYLRSDIGEVLVDDATIYNEAREFMQQVMPHNLRKLKHYQDDTPLFSRYQIESQIESAFGRNVRLPSGGAVVIDHTEALITIDINSARATKGSDIEETAFQTNLEAAEEISRQMRLRDLGGLIVIDFIDMMNRDNQRSVEAKLRESVRQDKARVQIGRISQFGLLELSRQRLRPSLGESSHLTCPRCEGHGSIRSVESLALSALRLAEEESMKEFTGRVIVQAPVPVANFLLNEKRDAVNSIEKRNQVPVSVVANPRMETPRLDVQRVRKNEVGDEASYELSTEEEPESTPVEDKRRVADQAEAPAVSGIRPATPAPTRAEPATPGWLKRLWNALAGLFSGRKTDDSSPRRSRDGHEAAKGDEKTKTSGQRGGKKRGGRGRGGQTASGGQQRDADTSPERPRGGKKKKTGPRRSRYSTGQQSDEPTRDKDESADSGSGDEGGAPKKKGRRRGGRKRGGRGRGRNQDAGAQQAEPAGNQGGDAGKETAGHPGKKKKKKKTSSSQAPHASDGQGNNRTSGDTSDNDEAPQRSGGGYAQSAGAGGKPSSGSGPEGGHGSASTDSGGKNEAASKPGRSENQGAEKPKAAASKDASERKAEPAKQSAADAKSADKDKPEAENRGPEKPKASVPEGESTGQKAEPAKQSAAADKPAHGQRVSESEAADIYKLGGDKKVANDS